MAEPTFDGASVGEDIARASALPGRAYHSALWFEAQRTRILGRTWHLYPLDDRPQSVGAMTPWSLLPGALDEPLLLAHDGTDLRCLSNVCTHRAKILVDRSATASSIRCGYHGRRFGLDGRVHSAPGFESVPDFPCATDHLPTVSLGAWERLLFANLDPHHGLEELLSPIRTRIDPIVRRPLRFDAAHSRQYDVEANWVLYCDNYLEGLHIPYVHPELNKAVEFESYRTELFPLGSVQIAIARNDAPAFDLPPAHPDHGQRVAAYYFWLFPTTMVNVYPWGLSLNAIQPQGATRTRVVYLRYVWDETLLETGAGSGLDQVEYEDEVVVASCARGTKSRLYDRGRYAPGHEAGVHHFHRLMLQLLHD